MLREILQSQLCETGQIEDVSVLSIPRSLVDPKASPDARLYFVGYRIDDRCVARTTGWFGTRERAEKALTPPMLTVHSWYDGAGTWRLRDHESFDWIYE